MPVLKVSNHAVTATARVKTPFTKKVTNSFLIQNEAENLDKAYK